MTQMGRVAFPPRVTPRMAYAAIRGWLD